jgi:hypothetical protein
MLQNIDRNEIIYRLANRGYSYHAIGKLFNLSKQRIWVIVTRYNRDNVSPLMCHLCLEEKDSTHKKDGYRLCDDCWAICNRLKRV